MKKLPPKWADEFLRWYCHPDVFEDIQGDLYELYSLRLRQRGKRYADISFVCDVFRLLRLPLLKNPLTEKKICMIVDDDTDAGTSIKVLILKPWNEILFETRNKDYGAYTIRNQYGRNMLVGFSFVLIIAVSVVLWWWLALMP